METTTIQPRAANPFVEAGEAFARLNGDRAPSAAATEHFDVIVIGGGQAGLAVGYYLARQGLRFVILDGGERIGDAWRHRWDSLRLFTPARYDGLPGMKFPAPPFHFPSKDEMGDYLEAYATRFALPVRLGARVHRLSRDDETFVIEGPGLSLRAEQVVVAMSSFQRPKIPSFAAQLRPEIVQLHSLDYHNGKQLGAGGVLVVGAGNSGAEIAVESAHTRETWLAGRDTGSVPFDIEGTASRLILSRLVVGFAFHHLLTVKTPLGRKLRPRALSRGGPLIRLRPQRIAEAGVQRVGRVVGVKDGWPQLDDGRILRVGNVVWCTGFDHGLSWIDLPILGEDHQPRHAAGIDGEHPGLYYVGQHFQYAFSSTMIRGVGRDARRIAKAIARRRRAS
jgi:putative flavoprotein involved in K+ transport